MTDFMKLSDEEIIKYIDRNFHLFAHARADDFPAKHLASLQRGSSLIIRREEGFAMVRKNTGFPFNIGPELMFLHVLPQFEGQGIGTQLIDQVKTTFANTQPITLTCETSRRKHFFEKNGFVVVKYSGDFDLYEMALLTD